MSRPASQLQGLQPSPTTAAPGVLTAVDTHAHVFTRDLRFAGDRRYAPAYDAPWAAYLAMLDHNSVSHGVLVQPSFLGTENGYLIQALQQAPDRLRGIAVVSPRAELEELEALARAGVVGIRLNLLGRGDPAFASTLWQRHLGRLSSLGWQVEVQAEAARLPHLLPPLLQAGVPLVVDHFGRPDRALGTRDPGFRFLLEAAAAGRIWVKLSGAYRNGGAETAVAAATELRAAFGPARLLWGSDWPHTQYEAVVSPLSARQALDAWVPDPAERRLVLADTPAQLFGFQLDPQSRQEGTTA